MNGIAIVIVTYNSAAEIGPCLAAAIPTGAEIVVIDNASADATRDEVSRHPVRLIANAQNLGFAAAVNQGFRATTAPFVLLLNPDAIITTPLAPLRDACDQPGTGAAGGRLTHPDGLPQTGFMVRRLPTPAALCLETLGINRLWPRNPVNWRFRCYDLDPLGTNPILVEQPAGAFLMIRRDAWQLLEGFDERFYPLWFEDVDFCRRLKAAALAVYYVPQVVAKHTGAHSIRSLRLENRTVYWYGSLLEYAARHYRPYERRLVCVSVIVGSVVRSFTGMFKRRGWTQWKTYSQVMALAGQRFRAQAQRRRGCRVQNDDWNGRAR